MTLTETDAPTRHGRRARRLTPEEEAAQQALAGAVSGDASSTPPVRGAMAPPGADAPVPRLRKFGRRARIIELDEPADATVQPAPEHAPDADGHPVGEEGASPAEAQPASGSSQGAAASAAAAPDATDAGAPTGTHTATIDRDADGVELGEMSVSEAPDPRPAPRFEGKVLQRSDRSTNSSLLWVVWALIGLAVLALIVLLATGVLGPGGDAGALGALLSTTEPTPPGAGSTPFLSVPTPLEVTSA